MSITREPTPHISSPITYPTAKFRSLKGKRLSGPSGSLIGLFTWTFPLCCKISALNFFSFFLALASVKAGHLLPYLQYQLYAKHKGPLFPGVTLRKTSDVSGSSQGLLQPSIHQKPHLQQQHNQESCPPPSFSRPCHGSIRTHSSAAHCTNPQNCHTASTHTITDLRQETPSDHPHKPPQSSVQSRHPSLGQRACQLQPQINSCCSDARSSCKTVELRR